MMEIVGDSVSHSSDYFYLLADYAVKIIKDGKAYADDTDAATVRILAYNLKTLTEHNHR
jgi:glutamyl-tRNA synthetase